jgi:tRNA G46 methylase TrmB
MALKGGNWVALERESSIAGLLAKKVVSSEEKNIRVYPIDFDEAIETLKDPTPLRAFILISPIPGPRSGIGKGA